MVEIMHLLASQEHGHHITAGDGLPVQLVMGGLQQVLQEPHLPSPVQLPLLSQGASEPFSDDWLGGGGAELLGDQGLEQL